MSFSGSTMRLDFGGFLFGHRRLRRCRSAAVPRAARRRRSVRGSDRLQRQLELRQAVGLHHAQVRTLGFRRGAWRACGLSSALGSMSEISKAIESESALPEVRCCRFGVGGCAGARRRGRGPGWHGAVSRGERRARAAACRGGAAAGGGRRGPGGRRRGALAAGARRAWRGRRSRGSRARRQAPAAARPGGLGGCGGLATRFGGGGAAAGAGAAERGCGRAAQESQAPHQVRGGRA